MKANGTGFFLRAGILSLVTTCFFAPCLYAQSYQSSQPHDGPVTAIVSKANEQSFFTAGKDGFLVKWESQGQGERTGDRYQVGELPVSLFDLNPTDNDVAICESDGLSTNRVSVYDWNSFNRRFAKRFKNPISCLAYSAGGNYLFIGTTAVNGIYILDAKNGNIIKNIKTIPGIITMAMTGASEKTAIMYSPSGYLYYWDMKKGNIKFRFPTESSLEQTCLFGSGKFQNRFFAGVKGNTIYVIDATNGITLASYAASGPMLASCQGDYEEGLFYVSDRGRGYSLSLISNESLEEYLTAPNPNALPSSSLVKNFMGLKSGDSFFSIAKNQESIILGTKEGDIYTFSDIKESETYSLAPITQEKFIRVSDICYDGKDFYSIASGKLYRMSFDGESTEEMAQLPSGMENMLPYGDGFILWSSSNKAPVYRLSLQTGTSDKLFSADAGISKLHIVDGGILYLQGSNNISLYNMETGGNKSLYSGTSIQDAILAGNKLYIAKSVTTANDSALMSVDLDTKETVPVKTAATVAFSLSRDDKGCIYGVAIESKDEDYHTQVFSYDTKSRAIRSLLNLDDEDNSAFTKISENELFTNIGKKQIYTYSLKTNRSSSYRRSSSLPVKAEGSSRLLAVLNKDGSISWYAARSKQPSSSWYLTEEGEWQAD